MNPCVFFAQRHGLALCGVSDDSDDGGNAAYQAFLVGGRSGFNALLSGGGVSTRSSTHDWKPTDSTGRHPGNAWFYNIGKGGLSLHRQREGNKDMALSVRCVRE